MVHKKSKHTIFLKSALLWSLPFFISLGMLISACGGGGGKRGSSTNTSTATNSGDEPDPGAENPIENPAGTQGNVEDVGIDVGEVNAETGVSFETTNEPKLVHLVVESSSELRDYKHTSEFMLVVRASEPTCVALKVRPGTAIADTVDEEAIRAAVEADEEACGGAAAAAVEAPAPEEEPVLEFLLNGYPTSGTSLNLSGTNNENNKICDKRLL